ncbi:hypothetical protein [Pedobacter yulinensis]|uniref:hypothetical protein n=1 Tax=Pedobacter yulinensis TaxID=2126353 RepID=UPI0013A67429|nr:hypothetical protein [Pedobacter yulinensis]
MTRLPTLCSSFLLSADQPALIHAAVSGMEKQDHAGLDETGPARTDSVFGNAQTFLTFGS